MHAPVHRPAISGSGSYSYDNAEEDASQPRFLDGEDGHVIAADFVNGEAGCFGGLAVIAVDDYACRVSASDCDEMRNGGDEERGLGRGFERPVPYVARAHAMPYER
jgi:hypothetical protein